MDAKKIYGMIAHASATAEPDIGQGDTPSQQAGGVAQSPSQPSMARNAARASGAAMPGVVPPPMQPLPVQQLERLRSISEHYTNNGQPIPTTLLQAIKKALHV